MVIILLFCFILFIFLFFCLNQNYIFEGLQENNSLPPLDILNYNIDNNNIAYHPTYIDNNVNSIGGFALPIFYKPNSYKYSIKSYVPGYVDNIYMSSLTGLSSVSLYYDISNNIVNTANSKSSQNTKNANNKSTKNTKNANSKSTKDTKTAN